MARPIKEGLDYFPLNVDVDQDDKIAIIEAEHGMLGFGIIIKLLMKIYSEGYYYDWTEKEQILFSRRVYVDIKQVNVIINDCVKWGLFDKELFDKYNILTSAGIQRRYLEIVKRRKRVEFVNQHILLHDDDINSYTNIVYVDINSQGELVNDDISTQSKVKKSKVKKSKVNNIDDDDINKKNIQDLESFYQVNLKRMPSSKDLQEMLKAYEIYKDIEFIKRTMDKAILKNKESHGELTIKSFSYFTPVLKEEWKKKQLGGGGDGTNTTGDEKENRKDGISSAERAGVVSL